MSTHHRGILVACDAVIGLGPISGNRLMCETTFEGDPGLDEVEVCQDAVIAGWSSGMDGEFCPKHAADASDAEDLS